MISSMKNDLIVLSLAQLSILRPGLATELETIATEFQFAHEPSKFKRAVELLENQNLSEDASVRLAALNSLAQGLFYALKDIDKRALSGNPECQALVETLKLEGNADLVGAIKEIAKMTGYIQ